ncbi:PTS sugar transporter subunit IIA [Clostridium grantii]|uniref:Ascorbate-specific PTS system EIIA component n=1 Tax=Clostridium grantii DSM 8605 TaxID=1121316 RepID=A0A1M5XCT7_9CLOT|nr:PTS sugar transporter subunit IIA [Clostridium grantii]SHH97620.1 PTS system, ascorbate-specific IIA component [Clostridium grantii DSM 8605]
MSNLKEFLLNKKTIRCKLNVSSWEEAVKICTDMLVEVDAINLSYYDNIIDFTKDIGPYYVIAPGLAMPHSRPGTSVKENCFSLITLEKPIKFGSEKNDPVDIIIVFAATEKETHTESIRQVVKLFSKPETFKEMRNANSIEELEKIIIKYNE